MTIPMSGANKERARAPVAQRAKFGEETPVTRQVEEEILFLAVMMALLLPSVHQKTSQNRVKSRSLSGFCIGIRQSAVSSGSGVLNDRAWQESRGESSDSRC